MAASNSTLHSPTTPNTTFVQANPSNFRAVVQKLTGASDDPSAHKLPLTLPTRLAAVQSHRPASAGEVIGPKKPNFKLHERRNAAAKRLELPIDTAMSMMMMSVSPTSSLVRSRTTTTTLVASPVSPLELFLARASPRTPHEEEEERAIAEKGFYLHPSPRASQPPELLPLFPLHSPTHNHNHNHTTNSPSIPN